MVLAHPSGAGAGELNTVGSVYDSYSPRGKVSGSSQQF